MGLDKNPKIINIKQLTDLASGYQRQAAINYNHLSIKMRQHGNIETADLFAKLVKQKDEHEKIALEIGCNIDVQQSNDDWKLPQKIIQDEMATHGNINYNSNIHDDVGDPFLLTPYNAICFALRNEIRNFDIFTHIASETTNSNLRLMAEKFAKEELSHMAALRLERLDVSRNLRNLRANLGWWQDINKISNCHELLKILLHMENITAFTYNNASQILLKMGDNKNSKIFMELSKSTKESIADIKIMSDYDHDNKDSSDGYIQQKITKNTFNLNDEKNSTAILLSCLKYSNQALDYVTFIAEKSTNHETYTVTSQISEILFNRLATIRKQLKIAFD